jgi:hypothetical protein
LDLFSGVGDSVRCYFCGGGLRNWEQGDNPMEEHARWFPKCAHILLVKGQQYVDKINHGDVKSNEVSLKNILHLKCSFHYYHYAFDSTLLAFTIATGITLTILANENELNECGNSKNK